MIEMRNRRFGITVNGRCFATSAAATMLCVVLLTMSLGCSVLKIEARTIEVQRIDVTEPVRQAQLIEPKRSMAMATYTASAMAVMANGMPVSIGISDLTGHQDFEEMLLIESYDEQAYPNGIAIKLFVRRRGPFPTDVSDQFDFVNRTGEFTYVPYQQEPPFIHRFAVSPKANANLPDVMYNLVVRGKPKGTGDDQYQDKAVAPMLLNDPGGQ